MNASHLMPAQVCGNFDFYLPEFARVQGI